ncbi:glycosyltransferase family 4 protein [Acidobacteria bacterium AH-259-G07]|nr:glycosyltransferase family 4 protein [Acidobacteria bacterium AH-259-G07]
MLNYEFPPVGGGAANATYFLLEQLAKKNLTIDLITASPDKIWTKEPFSSNITIYRLPVGKKRLDYWAIQELSVWSVKAYFLASRLVRDRSYHLCHCWFGWPCGAIALLLGQPYIVALRGSDVPGYNPRIKTLDRFFSKPLCKIVWRHAKYLTANSEGLRQLAEKTLTTQIEVIYNGVDVHRFKPAVKEKSDKLRILSAGRLIERKGFAYLIHALQGVDSAVLTIAGDGPLRASLRAQGEKEQVNLRLIGHVDQKRLAREYQLADIFVLPSLNEGMSNAVLEAMASSTPVIVTDVGGSKELVQGNGFIVPRKSASTLRQAILTYQKKPTLINEHGKRGRALAEEMSWGKVADAYLKLYTGSG